MPQFAGMWKAWPAGLCGVALLAVASTALASQALAAPLGATVVQLRDLPDPLLVESATPPPAAPAAPGDSPPPWASYVALVNYGSAPSVQGAVGPAHVVVMTTDYLRVLTRSGDVLHTVAVRDLAGVDYTWTVLACSLVFDPFRGRFIAAVAVQGEMSGPYRLRLLASQGADPLASWVAHPVETYKFLNVDRPRIAVTAKSLLLHAGETTKYPGPGVVWLFDAATLGSSAPPKGWTTNADPRMAPALVPPGEADRGDFLAWNPGAGTAIVRYSTQWDQGTAKLESITMLKGMDWAWSPETWWPKSAQKPAIWLRPYDGTAHGQVRGGLSWWAVPANQAQGSSPGVAWFAVADSGQVVHQGIVGGGENAAFAHPSLAVSAGLDVLVGFAYVDKASLFGASYALRMADDPAGGMRNAYPYLTGSSVLVAGAPCKYGCSLGPWSATVLDPLRDDLLWTFQPVPTAAGPGGVRFGVAVAAVATPCGQSPCGPCHRCEQGQCVAMADGSPCFDALLCTEQDRCQGGTCSGKARSCSSAGPCHEAATCDPTTGACQAAPINEGKACNDGNPCTVQDRCVGGGCAGAPLTCPSPDACHLGYCDWYSASCRVEPTYAPACLPEASTATIGARTPGGCTATKGCGTLSAWLASIGALFVACRRRQ